MNALFAHLRQDHDRLDRLFATATAGPGPVVPDLYAEFRRGLLRHIGIEERILLPALRSAGVPGLEECVAQVRRDHGAITALLVPSPSAAVVATLRALLTSHNALEEDGGGLYERLDALAPDAATAALADVETAGEVPVLPHNDRPGVLGATMRAVARAGHPWIGDGA